MAASLGLGHEAYYAYPPPASSSYLPPDDGAALELPPAAAAADCYFPELSACAVPDDFYYSPPPPPAPAFANGSGARGNGLTNMLSYLDDDGRRIMSTAAGSGGGGRASSRIGFRTRSEVDVLDDGFRWRKYGKKAVKSSPNPRNYYRCSVEGCGVKKRVERDSDDPRYVVTTYDGVHNHAPPGTGAGGGTSLVSPPRGVQHQRHASMCSAPPLVAAPWTTAPAGLDGAPLYAAAAHSSESSY